MDPARPSFKTVEIQPENQPPEHPVQPVVHKPPAVQLVGKRRASSLMFMVPAFLLLATIFLAGYFTNEYLQSITPQVPASVPMATLIPEAIPTPEAIIKSKLFFHPSLAFSFAYPENLALTDCGLDLYFFPAIQLETDARTICNDPKGVVLSLKTSRSNFYQKASVSEDVEEELVAVSGYDAILQKITPVGQTSFTKRLSFEGPDRFYLLSLTDSAYEQVFEEIYTSLAFKVDVTKNWRGYETGLGFSLKVPPEWQAVEQGSQLTIRKFTAKDIPSIVFEVGEQGNLTVAEFINSNKNLPGWKTQPKLDLRSIDGEIAQVIKGQLNGKWCSFVAVWYRGKLMQIAFTDEIAGDNEIVFEVMLATIEIQS